MRDRAGQRRRGAVSFGGRRRRAFGGAPSRGWVGLGCDRCSKLPGSSHRAAARLARPGGAALSGGHNHHRPGGGPTQARAFPNNRPLPLPAPHGSPTLSQQPPPVCPRRAARGPPTAHHGGSPRRAAGGPPGPTRKGWKQLRESSTLDNHKEEGRSRSRGGAKQWRKHHYYDGHGGTRPPLSPQPLSLFLQNWLKAPAGGKA